ncbi:MAG: UbiA family prenyltransferase [Candidatus Helarchaeota archaeon]|nr:UbiA family prenyltransferase [Candidatus Helarchaeota archaeon]
MSKLLDYIKLLRPSQWYKNLLIPAVGIFAINVFEFIIYLNLMFGFLIACGIAGANYIINDIMDAERDRIHPDKKARLIASGEISKRRAALIASVLLIISLGSSFLITFWFGIVMLSFFLLAQLYSFVLKKIAFADILTISINFIIRGLGGLVIIISYDPTIDLPTFSWAIWAVFIFALFLAISKRKVDLQLLKAEDAKNHKEVYDQYQKPLLDHLVIMVATCLLLGYYLYVIFNDPSNGFLLITVPPATYLMFRYLYLLFSADKHMGTPEKAIKDKGILIGSIVVLLLFFIIRYLDLYFDVI